MITGQKFRMWGRFHDQNGQLADPTNVFLRYKMGNSSPVTKSYGDGFVLKYATGEYYMDYTPTTGGEWKWYWYSTGNIETAHKAQSLTIEANDL